MNTFVATNELVHNTTSLNKGVTMLDDLKFIHQHDPSDAFGIAARQFGQLTESYAVTPVTETPTAIVFAGMGGSALPALLSTTWPGYTVPFEICRNYDIPAYLNSKTLFIACSYSGNTEETLSALSQAEAAGAQIIVIAAGGKLADIAKAKSYPLAIVPKAEQPRYAVFAMFTALITFLKDCNVFKEAAPLSVLPGVAEHLQAAAQNWLPEVPMAQNPAKQLATECVGKSAVVYAGPKLFPAAYKWKISFNENAKNIAWVGQYPEFNHNEFLGWSSHPLEKPYAVINLLSSFEHERIQKRFAISERLLSGIKPAAHEIQAQGESFIEQVLWTIAFGDFVTLYVAMLNGVDPAPVDLVEKLKTELVA